MIILATISINAVFGENGLIKKAEQSKETHIEAQAKEKLSLKLGEYQIEIYEKKIKDKALKDSYLCTKLSEVGPTQEAIDPKYYEVDVDGWLFWVDRETLEIVSKGKSTPILPEKIEMNESSVEVYIGEGKTIGLTLTPTNTSIRFLKWTSSDEEIAKINNGVVTGVKEGTATITVESTEDASIKTTCTVTVKPVELTGISLNKAATTISVGETETLEVTYEPENATYKDVTWDSSDKTVATVDNNGVVKGIKAGTTAITVTSTKNTSIKAECSVTVEQVVTINNIAELYQFAQSVNSGTSYSGYTVKLAQDITINEGVTYNYDIDSGLLEVTDGTNKFYIGTGNTGDTSGTNTTFDSSASRIGQYYLSDTSTDTAIPTENEVILAEGVTCNTVTLNNITLKKWKAIGADSRHHFSGTFDGQNNKISGIYSVESSDFSGFFGYVNNSDKIKDSTIEKSLMIGVNASTYICYATNNINIENIHSKENIIVGRGSSGGIIGYYAYTSGYSATLNKCSNSSVIISTGQYNGGIVGAFSNGNIQECYNTGDIIMTNGSNRYCAGIAGIVGYTLNSSNSTTNIKYCYNTGNISGYEQIAGIIADQYGYQNIENCYNSGNITSKNGQCGGIINRGSSYQVLKNCYNSGTIDAGNSGYGGGVSGNDGKISLCYNSGKIVSNYSSEYYGGIMGGADNNRLPSACAYIYYSDGKPQNGIGHVPVSNWSGSLDTGCTRYSESNWPYNILGVVNSNSTNTVEQRFTTTTGRDENHPVLKWEIGE